jgi:Type II secretion system (T2SS), protein E, N-terminal domain
VTFELGRSLLLADAIAPDALAQALYMVATQGVALPRALVATGAMELERLEVELARAEAPMIRHVVALPELVSQLPAGLCHRLLAAPVRKDTRTGTVDVAVVDARDRHAAHEVGFWLDAPVRILRTSMAAMEAALQRMDSKVERGVHPLAAPIWVPSARERRPVAETPIYGTRAVSLEELQAREAAASQDMDIPIPLSRRHVASPQIVEVDGDAVLPLVTRSKASSLIFQDDALEQIHDLKQVRAPRVPAAKPIADLAPSMPYADPSTLLARLRAANDRDSVVGLVLAASRTVARRVAVFAVKRDELTGWACTPDMGERAKLRDVHVPISASPLFAQALAGGTHLGKLPRSEALAPLLAVIGETTHEVALSAIMVEGRPAMLVLSDELGDSLLATQRLDEIARTAGVSLSNVVRKRASR